jgi:hypothetical protein
VVRDGHAVVHRPLEHDHSPIRPAPSPSDCKVQGPGGIEGPRQDHRCGRCALCSVPLARPPVRGTLAWPGHGANAVYRPYGLSVPREDREGPGQINEYRPR